MRKVLNFVNDNKKIIIVVILIIVLVGTIYLMKPKDEGSASTGASQMSPTEAKLTAILSSINGVGETEVMINEGESGVLGVVIVCVGADNIMTKNDILNAVSTALSVDKKIIAIYSKK